MNGLVIKANLSFLHAKHFGKHQRRQSVRCSDKIKNADMMTSGIPGKIPLGNSGQNRWRGHSLDSQGLVLDREGMHKKSSSVK